MYLYPLFYWYPLLFFWFLENLKVFGIFESTTPFLIVQTALYVLQTFLY